MRFVRNTWYAAIWSDELGRELVGRRFLNEPVLLYRKLDGTPVALDDRCPHRFAPLSMGILKDDDVECLYHGLRFDCAGACIDNPNGSGIVPKVKLRSYPVHEIYGMVWIWMGAPERADPAAVPDLSFMTDPECFTPVHGYMKIDANYLLMLDNLTDLSHSSFVHVDTFEPREMARENFEFSEENGTVWAKLFYSGMKVPPFFRGLPNLGETVDHWLEMRADPPGVMVTYYGVTPLGASREEGYNTIGPNLITPETDWTTHYFWGGGRNYMLDDEEMTRHTMDVASVAFWNEDKPIIEGQQKMIGRQDIMTLRPLALANDTASRRARRNIEIRIEEEAAVAKTT